MSAPCPPLPPHPQDSRHRRFLDLIRGHRRGLGPAFLRLLLWLASLLYGLAVRLRNIAYDRDWRVIHRVGVPVFSVGNLTVGGTGKTPAVEFIARHLRSHDVRVALLSRGYGSVGDALSGGPPGRNDEALVLEENLPDVPHLQGRDRVQLAHAAIEELESEVLLLDDGFQHRRLARDLDLVLIDATDPFGGGYLLPRGLLREPASSLRRADAILFTRCDQVDPSALAALRQQVDRVAPGKPRAESEHRPQNLVNSDGDTSPLELLHERPVLAFCGIGNPEAFRRTLADLAVRLVDFLVYPDHHPYTAADVHALRTRARASPPDALVVTTQKDLVKLRLSNLAARPLWAVRIGLAFSAGQAELEALIRTKGACP